MDEGVSSPYCRFLDRLGSRSGAGGRCRTGEEGRRALNVIFKPPRPRGLHSPERPRPRGLAAFDCSAKTPRKRPVLGVFLGERRGSGNWRGCIPQIKRRLWSETRWGAAIVSFKPRCLRELTASRKAFNAPVGNAPTPSVYTTALNRPARRRRRRRVRIGDATVRLLVGSARKAATPKPNLPRNVRRRCFQNSTKAEHAATGGSPEKLPGCPPRQGRLPGPTPPTRTFRSMFLGLSPQRKPFETSRYWLVGTVRQFRGAAGKACQRT